MKARLQWLLFLVIVFLQPSLNITVCPVLCQCQTYGSAPSMNVVSCHGLGLKYFPINIDRNVTHLDLSSNRISEISVNNFRHLSSLRELILTDNPIMKVADGTFDYLSSLQSLCLSETFIEIVPVITVASSVVHLHLDNTNIKELSSHSLRHYSNLKSLYLKRSKIKHLTSRVFRHTRKLKHLLMEYSMLDFIDDDAFDGIQLHTLSLQGTHINSLPANGLEKLVNLNLEDVNTLWHLRASQLPNIRPLLLKYEFLCCSFVDQLSEDVGETGGEKYGALQECKRTEGVDTEFPAMNHLNGSSLPKKPNLPSMFPPSLSTLTNQSTRLLRKRRKLSSSSSGNHKTTPSQHEPPSNLRPKLHRSTRQDVKNPTTPDSSKSFPTSSFTYNTKLPSKHSNHSPTNMSVKRRRITRSQIQNDFVSLSYNGSLLLFTLHPCDPEPAGRIAEVQLRKKRIVCRRKADEFNPCEDLLGSLTLRVSTWLIAVCATTGNLVTLIVILLNRRKVSNHKLLMCTLAFSSLCMGVYLFILAAVDAGTRGSYNKHAKQWQQGVGCKIAGFLSVFSTELSVLTLNIITLERYYTILFPLHQAKWMTVKQTTISLVLSFFTAFLLAVLPLTGISSYTKVAICLPFDVRSLISKAYVTFLLASNGASFFAVLFAYTKMYLNIQHTARGTFTDLNIAKKMAVIVLTNFLCWAPIAVFSLFAIYGEPLIDVPMSKFLMVFVFPINALTNPFLYFLVTKRFQQDLRTIVDRCPVCVCFAGASYSGRGRTESVRTSFTRTSKWRSRSRSSSSANTLNTIFRRPPRRNSTDNQNIARRLSVSRGVEERHGSMLQRTVTFLLPKSKRQNAEVDTMFISKTLRRKSYQIAARNNNILPEERRTCLIPNYHECPQNRKKCEIHFVCESAC